MDKLFKCGGRMLDMSKKTYIMGILNVTPDSFSDGGKYFDADRAEERAKKMALDGADIIDIGAQSTRPGCKKISPQQEWDRLKTVLPNIINALPDTVISLDTFYPQVAEMAAQTGIDIINDVSGGSEKMLLVAEKYNLGIVIMHPGDSNDTICRSRDIAAEVEDFFISKKKQAISLGLDERQICFDPGIGFGKTNEENLWLISQTKRLSAYSAAYLMGLSKKRVTNTGGLSLDDRLSSTVSLNTYAQLGGASILRVHDVYEAAIAAKPIDMIKKL